MRKPPRLATSLLNRFREASDPSVGDVLEQFRAGKSTSWYWRQVIGMISHAVVRDVRDGWPLVVGVTAGAVVLTMFTPLVNAAIETFDEQLFIRGFGWFYVNGYRVPSMVSNHPWSITAAVYCLIGWAVGRVAGRRQAGVVLAFAVSVFVCSVALPLGMSVDYPNLSYHFAFHSVPLKTILTRHFIVNGNVDFMNVFVFNGVILPLVTLIAGLLPSPRGSTQRGAME